MKSFSNEQLENGISLKYPFFVEKLLRMIETFLKAYNKEVFFITIIWFQNKNSSVFLAIAITSLSYNINKLLP